MLIEKEQRYALTLLNSNSSPATDGSWPLSFRKPTALLSLIALMLITFPYLGTTIGPPDHSSRALSRVSSPFTQPPDFSIGATSPNALNVNQSAVSTIVINALNYFVGFVAINGTAPYGLMCDSIMPPVVRVPGIATVSCSAPTAGEYNLTLTGTSGSLTHKTTATFNFVDFKIKASSPTGAVGASLLSTISIIALNGFNADIAVTAVPQSGLTCGPVTPSEVVGSGIATISCSATSVGEYVLTVYGTSGSLTHSASATFDIANLRDFSIGATSASTADADQSSTSMITITAFNGFTGRVALTDAIPPNLSCQTIVPSTIQSSGMATVSCSSNTAGTYFLTILGTSNSLSHSAIATFNFVDFRVTASSPATSNVDSSASSNIIIGSLNGFVGTVSLSDTIPAGLTCEAISPNNVLSSGTAVIFCSATTAGTYILTATATSRSLSHSVTATFTFADVSPDFTITAPPSLSFTSGTAGTSTVSVSGQNSFDHYVMLSYQVVPTNGLIVGFDPATLYPGESTATFSSSTPGSYTVKITGTYGSLIRTATVQVTVTAPGSGTPDVALTPSVLSLSFNSGASGTAIISIAPQNDFAGTITLTITAPAGVLCGLSAAVIQSSGTITLICSSNTAGDYKVTITAKGGPSQHTTTANVHVLAVSPAAPAPSIALRLAPAALYSLIAAIIVIAVVGAVLIVRSRRSAS